MKKHLANYIYDDIVVKNLVTNEILIFNNTKDVANYLNTDTLTITHIINSKKIKVYNIYEIIHYNKNYESKHRDFRQYEYIKIQNIKTNEILTFNNTKQLREYLNVSSKSIYNLLERRRKDIKKEWILLETIKVKVKNITELTKQITKNI